jgi:hypothetical protein
MQYCGSRAPKHTVVSSTFLRAAEARLSTSGCQGVSVETILTGEHVAANGALGALPLKVSEEALPRLVAMVLLLLKLVSLDHGTGARSGFLVNPFPGLDHLGGWRRHIV